MTCHHISDLAAGKQTEQFMQRRKDLRLVFCENSGSGEKKMETMPMLLFKFCVYIQLQMILFQYHPK